MLDEWLARALRHGDALACELREVQRIGAGLRQGDVAIHTGDAQQLDARMCHCKAQRHGIVYAGIGVENNGVNC